MATIDAKTHAAVIAGAVGGCVLKWLWGRLRQRVFAPLADRDSAELRRRACQPSEDLSAEYCVKLPGSFEVEKSKTSNLNNERGFITLRSGLNIFFQIWTPKSGNVKAGLVLIHGFGDHCDFQKALMAKSLAAMGDFAIAAFDLPGHGRSDGVHVHVPDWLDFVDAAREIVVEHLRPMLSKGRQGLKVFAVGESMGAGVLFSMLVRERELFDGAILVCPMLFVSKHLMPPWIIIQLFKYVAVPLLPLWPISPNKNLKALINKDPSVQEACATARGHSSINYPTQPRLATGNTLAFVAGEWMKSKLSHYDTPSLIFHGGGDLVTDPQISEQLFKGMAHADKELFCPDGVWHGDLFHGGPKLYEENRKHYEALVAWVSKRA